MKHMKDIRKLHMRLSKAEEEVVLLRGLIEGNLESRIKFDFFIGHQASDGITVVHAGKARLAPLIWILAYLEKNESISEEEFYRFCI